MDLTYDWQVKRVVSLKVEHHIKKELHKSTDLLFYVNKLTVFKLKKINRHSA